MAAPPAALAVPLAVALWQWFRVEVIGADSGWHQGTPNRTLAIHFFAGEADACVPFTDNEYWTNNMGYKLKPGEMPA